MPDLQKINLSTLILSNIFLRKCCHALSSCSQYPWNPNRTRLTFSQSQHSNRLLNVIEHRHTINIILFVYKVLILNQKTALVLLSVTSYWTSVSDCFKSALITLHWLSGSYTYKIAPAIIECKIFTRTYVFCDSFISQLLNWLKFTHIDFLDLWKCYHTVLAALVLLWTLIYKIINTT